MKSFVPACENCCFICWMITVRHCRVYFPGSPRWMARILWMIFGEFLKSAHRNWLWFGAITLSRAPIYHDVGVDAFNQAPDAIPWTSPTTPAIRRLRRSVFYSLPQHSSLVGPLRAHGVRNPLLVGCLVWQGFMIYLAWYRYTFGVWSMIPALPMWQKPHTSTRILTAFGVGLFFSSYLMGNIESLPEPLSMILLLCALLTLLAAAYAWLVFEGPLGDEEE